MKQTGPLLNRLGILGLAAATILSLQTATAQSTQQGKAVVRAVNGSASYSVGGGTWNELKPGITLRSGSVIQTAAESHVDLYLGPNGPVARVGADSTLGIDKLTYTDTGADSVIDTQFDLQKGILMGNVRKMAAASRYEIKTPNGVAGIRGTNYVITDRMILFILEGLGHVAYILPNNEILSESVSTGEVFVPPGNKRPITREEFDRYSPMIADLLAGITDVDPVDFQARIYVEPDTGEQPVSPTDPVIED